MNEERRANVPPMRNEHVREPEADRGRGSWPAHSRGMSPAVEAERWSSGRILLASTLGDVAMAPAPDDGVALVQDRELTGRNAVDRVVEVRARSRRARPTAAGTGAERYRSFASHASPAGRGARTTSTLVVASPPRPRRRPCSSRRRCAARTAARRAQPRPRRCPGVNRQWPSCGRVAAVRVDDRARRARQRLALEEGAIVVPGEEARLLALGAPCGGEPGAAASARVSSFVWSPSGNQSGRGARGSTAASMYDWSFGSSGARATSRAPPRSTMRA